MPTSGRLQLRSNKELYWAEKLRSAVTFSLQRHKKKIVEQAISRIWEMKEGKYTKILAEILSGKIFHT